MLNIAFVGAGSTVFMKNLIGDILLQPDLGALHFALMDIDATRLAESERVVQKLISSLSMQSASTQSASTQSASSQSASSQSASSQAKSTQSATTRATVSCFTDLKSALEGADFVIVAFQIGGYKPCTVTDFEWPKRYGLQQTIADTLGIGGIMRGLRTVPHLWHVAETMREVCPHALMLQYVNPMAINTWALNARYADIQQVGLCHSVQGTAFELARDLGLDLQDLRYRAAGINHMSFYLNLEAKTATGWRDLYPDLLSGYQAGHIPLESHWNPRCPNLVRYEVMSHLGYFVTESSEHFAEYVPWFIKSHRPDLVDTFRIPLDEYPRRCEEQIDAWKAQLQGFENSERIEHTSSNEYAARIIKAVVTGEPAVIYGNVANHHLIPQLPEGAAVEVPCLVDALGIQPTQFNDIPTQLIALMRTNINVQELTVKALLQEDKNAIYHAAMLDPHTAAELDLRQIRQLVDDLLKAHADWLPAWCQ